MAEKRIPLPVPHEQREQILPPGAFEQQMARRGWTVTQVRQAYMDPDVFRQQWLVCPHGARYPERSFYRFFGSTPTRKLFRYALAHVPCTRDALEKICPHEPLLTSSLTFLQDQEWFHIQDRRVERGAYQAHISNIGRTLEWYVAEWFRLTCSITRLVSVRHGVQFAEMPLPGDLDVVAILENDLLVVVECKSSNNVDQAHFSLFLQRVKALHPDIAILLIDTSAPFSPERIRAFNAALGHLGQTALIGNGGFYLGTQGIYVVTVEHSIATSLQDVLRYHHWRMQSS